MLSFDSTTALIIAPHPDDEVFGCGGLIHRLKQSNSKVYVLYMTVGATEDFSPDGVSTMQERVKCIEQVTKFLNIDGYSLALPGEKYHLKLDSIPQKELVHVIECGNEISLESIRPDIVLTPTISDYNQDHRAVSQATMTAVRPAFPRYKSFQPVVLTYELPYQQWNISEYQPSPSLYVKLSPTDINVKVTAIEFYKSQLKVPESPLSIHGIKTLASYRGLQCGTTEAEAYGIKRLVI